MPCTELKVLRGNKAMDLTASDNSGVRSESLSTKRYGGLLKKHTEVNVEAVVVAMYVLDAMDGF